MILLDTCALLWLAMEPAKLSVAARRIIETRTGLCYVSAVSASEIAQKHSRGKLELPLPPNQWFERACLAHDLTPLPMSPAHAFAAGLLPDHHRDPFDRLIIATAQVHHLTLLTTDPQVHRYEEVNTVW